MRDTLLRNPLSNEGGGVTNDQDRHAIIITDCRPLISMNAPSKPTSRSAFNYARTCYGHAAGEFGCALCDALLAGGFITSNGDEFRFSAKGAALFDGLGITLPTHEKSRKTLAPVCIDGTERRPHLGGEPGRALTAAFIERNWIERLPDSRVLKITETGQREFAQKFGLATSGATLTGIASTT